MWNVSQAKRVLVVDDEVLIADTLTAVLRLRGYQAVAVYSAEQALEWCRGDCPDAVITDVVMGPMNGVQLAAHLRQTHPGCKVLLISGNITTAYLLLESNAGGYNFPILPKPAHPEDILGFLAAVQTVAPPSDTLA